MDACPPFMDVHAGGKRCLWRCRSTLEATQGQILSQSPKYYLREVVFVWELTKETIDLPLGCLQGWYSATSRSLHGSILLSDWCFVFGIWCLVFWVHFSGFGFRVSDFRVWYLVFRISGFGFRVSGFGSQILGFRATFRE